MNRLILSLFCLSMVHSHAEELGAYVREQTQQIVGEVPSLSYEQRYTLVHTTPESIYRSDRARFIAFLQLPLEKSALEADQLASLKNDVADRLLSISSAVDDLAQLFLDQLTDESQGPAWQSYVLQKLGPASLKVQDPVLCDALITRLQQIASHPSVDATAGTALIALINVANNSGAIDTDAVGQLALSILQDDRHEHHSRATAMTIGAEVGQSACIDFARTLLSQPRQPLPLRVGAIATLGIAGTPDDLPILTTYTKSSDIRISHAARYTITRLEARAQQ